MVFQTLILKFPIIKKEVFDLPGKKNRTKVVKKNFNPVWNHTFDVEFNPQICNKLDIEVFDYDTLGKDDLIGNAVISLDWMKSVGQDTFDQWIPLNANIKDKKTKTTKNIQKGSVHLKIQVKYRPQNLMIQQSPGSQPIYQQQMYPPQQGQPSQMNQPMLRPIQAQQPAIQPPLGNLQWDNL